MRDPKAQNLQQKTVPQPMPVVKHLSGHLTDAARWWGRNMLAWVF